jgi:hypothetical protein
LRLRAVLELAVHEQLRYEAKVRRLFSELKDLGALAATPCEWDKHEKPELDEQIEWARTRLNWAQTDLRALLLPLQGGGWEGVEA